MKRIHVFWCGLLLGSALGCGGDHVSTTDAAQPPAADSNYRTLLNPPGELGIVRRPAAADYTFIHGGKLNSLPVYDPNSEKMWQVDLRSTDVSQLDLAGRLADLSYANFDSKTRWPAILPAGFDPAVIMELGKNPGLHVRDLHKQGITGKGIGIAIIDQGLLVDHVEYRDRLKSYEEIHSGDGPAQMHGPAVASIAVGKTVGVAPEADLYYIAETHGVFHGNQSFDWDLSWLAKSIDRIVEINMALPKENRIRVISISLGIGTHLNNGDLALAAITRAAEAGIYTVYVNAPLAGLGRELSGDPDDFAARIPGTFLSGDFYANRIPGGSTLWIPMDSRSTASPTGSEDYVFYREGGMSWTVPYVAGLYALACQVKPDITPELFLNTARETGAAVDIQKDGKNYRLERIVDPVKLVAALGSP